jgi:hypothetical protein
MRMQFLRNRRLSLIFDVNRRLSRIHFRQLATVTAYCASRFMAFFNPNTLSGYSSDL